MAEVKKECWSCNFYRPYYTMGYCRFDKQDLGYCSRSKEQVADKHNTCGLWCRNHWSRSMRKQVALRSLLEILQNLEHVRIILEEEHEINKTDPLE